MIFSKASLRVVDVTKADKAIPALDNVHLRSDGTAVATNGNTVVAVSGVSSEMVERVPLDNREMKAAETVTAETVREVLKNIPRDTTFGGVLENCDYAGGKFILTDGKRRREITAKTYTREYAEYGKVFERVGRSNVGVRVAVNLRRLVDVLGTIDKMFPDSSKNMPVYLEFTDANDVIMRCIDVRRGRQRVIAVVKSYSGVEGAWLERDEWERELMGVCEGRKISKVKREIKSLQEINLQMKKNGEQHERRWREGIAKVKKRLRKKGDG